MKKNVENESCHAEQQMADENGSPLLSMKADREKFKKRWKQEKTFTQAYPREEMAHIQAHLREKMAHIQAHLSEKMAHILAHLREELHSMTQEKLDEMVNYIQEVLQRQREQRQREQLMLDYKKRETNHINDVAKMPHHFYSQKTIAIKKLNIHKRKSRA